MSFALVVLHSTPAAAWILAEHVRITRAAVAKIEGHPAEAATLLESANALGVCATSQCSSRVLSVVALPSVAGDHSCEPIHLQNALANPKEKKVLLDVLRVGDEAAIELATLDKKGGGDPNRRVDIRRALNLKLQLVDDDYANRTELDWSHFQQTRGAGPIDLEAYLRASLDPGADSNATAAYANYHVVALRLAADARVAGDAGRAAERAELLRRALLAEVFAVHFLEDAFSSGHFTGHWGSDEVRLGSHDHYAVGVEAMRWKSFEPPSTGVVPYVAHGDGFISEAEVELVGNAVAASWLQVLSVASSSVAAAAVKGMTFDTPGVENFDSCRDQRVAPDLLRLVARGPVRTILAEEPVPARRSPALQRFRAEKSVFIGVAAGGDLGLATLPGLYDPGVDGDKGLLSHFRATLRLGYGAAGFTDDPLNSLAFGDAGFTGLYVDATNGKDGFAATGFTFRIRAPGLVTFLDGGLAILLADTTRNPCFIKLAAEAAHGGVGRLWRSFHLAGPLYWQFAAGHDVTYNYFPEYLRVKLADGAIIHESRHEFLIPILSARSSIPIAGDRWAQSTDVQIDMGTTYSWSTSYPTPVFGAFFAFSGSTRVFP